MPRRSRRRALSIRQPYLEQILSGEKTVENRGRPTAIRARVYLYAPLQDAGEAEFEKAGIERGSLPTGRILGSVEIIGCRRLRGRYQWLLARPMRLARPLRPSRHPQPGWFYPW